MSIPEGAGTSIRLLGASVLIGCNIVPRHPFINHAGSRHIKKHKMGSNCN